jgi:hypothetical protein
MPKLELGNGPATKPTPRIGRKGWWGKGSHRGNPWHEGLACLVRSLSFDFANKRGELHLPPNCCCDMSGCIAVFQAIDPEVKEVQTFAGKEPDTRYWHCLDEDRWIASWQRP